MDPVTALKPDVYRTVAIVLVPGFVASAPWVVGVMWPELQHASTWTAALVPISVTMLAIVLVTGIVLEDIGSRIETFMDKCLRGTLADFERTWWQYLRLPCEGEVVAQRYLRSTLTRFKFELSMVPAATVCAVGIFVAQLLGHGMGWTKTLGLMALLALLALFLYFEAKAGVALLSRVRTEIVKARTPS